MKTKRIILLSVLALMIGAPAFAQDFRFGAKAGVAGNWMKRTLIILRVKIYTMHLLLYRNRRIQNSGMCCRALMTSSDFTPLTIATRQHSFPCRSLLVTIVRSSPFDMDVSSIARCGPIFSGKTSHSSAWSSSDHVR